MSALPRRLRELVPGGCHTYSKGHDRLPANAPLVIGGHGGQLLGADGRLYVDWAMGINNVLIGHAESSIDGAAWAAMAHGQALSGATRRELEAAEAVLSLFPAMDMVKFAKNGTDANDAAIKLARAVTGRQTIAYDGSAPFFSSDDWWVSGSLHRAGTLQAHREFARTFRYNDIESVEQLFGNSIDEWGIREKPACLLMEVCRAERPQPGFLERIRELCNEHGTLLIFDEVVTGFRYHLHGAQALYGVTPDLMTLGKGLANGHAVSALLGKRKYMELGDLSRFGTDGVFLLSTTNGAEQSGLAAAIATIGFYERHDVIGRLTQVGTELVETVRKAAEVHGIGEYVTVTTDFPNRPMLRYRNADGEDDAQYRELFQQEMFCYGVWWAQWVCPCYRRTDEDMRTTLNALDHACAIYAAAIRDGSATPRLRRRPG
jgi:glutamate-1-semialdehyde 2,1-aminomutase